MKTKIKIISIFAAAVLIVWLWWGNTALEVNSYEISSERIPKAFSGFRIAQISDLHNAEFGEGNAKLISMLFQADPDIIVITGDLIDSRNTDAAVALDFALQAVQIAPVYYVTGNHEARVREYRDLKTGLTEAGVTVLENEKVTMERAGERVTLIGLDDPSFWDSSLSGESIRSALDELQDVSDGYTVLLAHRPELFDVYADSGVDLVFSGHAHGGQFRLPFVGGLVAPNQGLFPKYDSGLYIDGTTNMLVSRGVGNSIIPVRFNNRPEIIVAELRTTGY